MKFGSKNKKIKKKQENRKIKKLSLFELQNTEKGMLFRIGKKF